MIRFLIGFIVFIMLGISACAFVGYLGYEQIHTKVTHTNADTIVTVNRGESTDMVLSKLESMGVISNKLVVKAYIKLTGKRSMIKAGDFKFKSPITAIEVLEVLNSGVAEHDRFTVIEGSTIFDVADALKVSFPEVKSKAEAMTLLQDVSLIKEIDPAAKNLEGYIFPDTYFIQKETTASELVSRMVQRFKKIWQKKLARNAEKRKMSIHDTVVVASIIETEAKLTEERPVVASVIYNRLKKGMNLSVDSTVVYASKLNGKWRDDGKIYKSDLRLKSPYNTRMYRGLPPGPVSNPGLSSLKAALNPSDTRYIYYVRDPDFDNGKHNFFITSAEFTKGVKKLRSWEASQKK